MLRVSRSRPTMNLHVQCKPGVALLPTFMQTRSRPTPYFVHATHATLRDVQMYKDIVNVSQTKLQFVSCHCGGRNLVFSSHLVLLSNHHVAESTIIMGSWCVQLPTHRRLLRQTRHAGVAKVILLRAVLGQYKRRRTGHDVCSL